MRILLERGEARPSRERDAARRSRGVIAGAAVLGLVGLFMRVGQAAQEPAKKPPAHTIPAPRPPDMVEMGVPAGIKVAITGSKMTRNSATGETVAEGEAMIRLSDRVWLRTHQARVRVAKGGSSGGSRILIEPMPVPVAEK